jgi:hypothetical protein
MAGGSNALKVVAVMSPSTPVPSTPDPISVADEGYVCRGSLNEYLSNLEAEPKLDNRSIAKSVQEPNGTFHRKFLILSIVFVFLVSAGVVVSVSRDEAKTGHNEHLSKLSKALEMGSIPTRSYTDVQFIALTLSTRQYNEGIPGEHYVGSSDSNHHHFKKEIQAKVNVMRTALERARSDFDLDHRDSTLKVFMAPEFFFRSINGAYQPEGELQTTKL